VRAWSNEMTNANTRPTLIAAALWWAGASALAQSVPLPAPSRGELLYGIHCITCHSVQIHWRDKNLVTDWDSLKAVVQLMQASAKLGWSDADIVDVAHHLNTTIYRFAPAGSRVGAATRGKSFAQAAAAKPDSVSNSNRSCCGGRSTVTSLQTH